MKKIILTLILCTSPVLTWANEDVELMNANVDLNDLASLQRGSRDFMNYCSGCHSLQYLRYNRFAKDLGITDHYGDVLQDIMQQNLIFTDAKIADPILSAIPKESKDWFGVTPPDLTLTARVRGSDWIYTYLSSFYKDDKRHFGANNVLFPDVSMPNVLESLQGIRVPAYKDKVISFNGGTKTIQVIDHLQLVREGSMTQQEFEQTIHDLVNFLTYAAEPVQVKRQHLGMGALVFLLAFGCVTYLLKKEYWKDVKKNHKTKGEN